jgi:hypothetical protein
MATLVDIDKLPSSEEARDRMRAAIASGASAQVLEERGDEDLRAWRERLDRAEESGDAAEPFSAIRILDDIRHAASGRGRRG